MSASKCVGGVLLIWFSLIGCQPINLFERTVVIPQQAWKSSFVPSFSFTIRDTTSFYDLSLVLRHRDAYHYNNIWLALTLIDPAGKTVTILTEKKLGTNENGWLGVGMDDIYEHRISIQAELLEKGVSLRQQGQYQLRVKQLMREDPLQGIMHIGLHIEKRK